MHYSVREVWAARQATLAALAAAVGVRADGEDPTVVAYRARQEQLLIANQAVFDDADKAKRELTAEEKKLIADNAAEVERLESEIELRSRQRAQAARLDEPMPRRTAANASDPAAEPARSTPVQTTHLSSPLSRAMAQGNWGWRTLGDFARGVHAAVTTKNIDPRLQNALSTYGSEGVGADGGFAVPPEYRNTIMQLVTGEDTLFSRCDANPTESNSVTVPTDDSTAWGTSGVRVYSRAEAAAMTQSKPALKDLTTRLNEIYAFVPVTDELLDDAPMLGRFLTTKAGQAIDFKVNDYIINGSGVSQPLGIMNAACLVTVSKESSQTAATIHAKNIAKMWARMPARNRAGAVWLVNQDVESALMQLGFQIADPAGTTATGGVPLFVPPGGLSALPYATLMGKPVITTEACATLGTTGDIIFANLKGYFLPYKASGVKSDVSMHLYFDQGVTAFRWTMRLGGQPWLQAAIARKSGNNTLSDFVALESR